MSYLRFHRHEYEAIARLCRPLDLHSYSPHTLKHFLVGALADGHAALSGRLARLPARKVQILLYHLRDRRPPAGKLAFTAVEMETLANAFGPLQVFARLGRLLKRALVRHLLTECPDLAEKIHRLAPEPFEALCGLVLRRLKRGA